MNELSGYLGGGSVCPGCGAIEHLCDVCDELGNWAETLDSMAWLNAHRLSKKELHWVLKKCYDGNDCYYVGGN